jgi:hypothetical protein
MPIPVYSDLDAIQRPVNGNVGNPAWADQVNDNCKFLASALAAHARNGRVYATSGGAVSTTGIAVVTTFTADFLGGDVTQGGSGGLIIGSPGTYWVRAQGSILSGTLTAGIMKNGALVRYGTTGGNQAECTDIIELAAADVIQLGLGSVAAATTDPLAGLNCSISVQCVSTATPSAANVNSGF